MSETKFTPGPWHWMDYGSLINIESEDCSSIASLFSYATQEIEEPNAHLIAAAPTMYDALEELLRYANDSNDCQYGTLSTRLVKAIAEAALAKARGEINE